MDELSSATAEPRTLDASIETEENPVVEATSQEYLGRWNRLVSTTNWEKGRIICQWREALMASDSPPSSYTDEAWSRRAGSVTPQHTGRLRRTYQKFAETYEDYEGLYWSHFQASLDWDDPEMWLEGAVQSGWSVSQMRDKRWESIGAPPELKPRDADIIVTELDEDTTPAGERSSEETIGESFDEVRSAADDDPAFGGDDSRGDDSGYGPTSESADSAPFRPFENVPTLPSDLNEAVESMKLAIVHHKMAQWEEISCDGVLAALEALRQLVLSPAE
jgi:hypothetical protein